MKVKVCGNKSVESVHALCELGVDYLGFIFVAASSRNLVPEELPLLKDAIGQSAPQCVGVFRDSEPEKIVDIADSFGLSVIQLHGTEDREYIARLREILPPSTQVWKAVGISSAEDFAELSEIEDKVDRFLFDTKSGSGASGGTGSKFAWELLENYRGSTPYFIAGGIEATDASVVRSFCSEHSLCEGVDVNSKFEVEPGKKDVLLVKQFLKEIA